MLLAMDVGNSNTVLGLYRVGAGETYWVCGGDWELGAGEGGR